MKSVNRASGWSWAGILLLLLFAQKGRAQIEVFGEIDMNYPLLFNSNNAVTNYGQISFGPRLGVAYKPDNVQFFPMLSVGMGRTRLPVKQFNTVNVAAINMNYMNVMANENYVVHFINSELDIYGGVGFSYLVYRRINIGGSRGETMKVAVDSVKYPAKFFPAMNIGFEYIYGESQGKDLYLSLGVNFQYILLLKDRNDYYISVNDPQSGISNYKGSLSGNVISPGFYLSLHYKIHK